MQHTIDTLFDNLEKETNDSYDITAQKINNYIAKLRGMYFATKPNPSKKKEDIDRLKKIAKELGKVETEYDYKDFVRFAIRTTKKTKYENFPSITKIASKIKVWGTAVNSQDLPMHLFNPVTVAYNGEILNKKLNTYFGFKSESLNEYFTQSTTYYLLVDRIIKPILRSSPPEDILYKDLNKLEWATACSIRYRYKYNLAKTLYLVWKVAKNLPRRYE